MKKIVKSIKEYKNDNIYIQYRNGDVGADDPVRPLVYKEYHKKQNGITLVALVITIIVLLLLATVSIKIIMDGGLITKSSEATKQHEIASEKEAIQTGYAAYQVDLANKETEELKVEGANVEKTEKKWNIIFTKTKNEYQLSEDGNILLAKQNGEYVIWKDNGDGTFTKGEVTLKVGDYINYDATKDANGNEITEEKATYTSYSEANASLDKNNGRSSGYKKNQIFNLNSYTSGWRVLGIENGNLRIISADIIGTDSEKYYLQGKKGYIDGAEELNAISAMYGQGKGAIGAKSITVEDINKITGYDPENTGNGKPHASKRLDEYGNKVTYYWDGTDKPYYEGKNGIRGNLTISHNTFNWCDETTCQSSEKSTTATTDNKEKITELISNLYSYNPITLTESNNGEVKGIEQTSNEWEILFMNEEREKAYWIASNYVRCFSEYTYFGMRVVFAGRVTGVKIFNSYDISNGDNFGIRPVVTLKSDIQIEKTDVNDGTTLEKACIIK